MNEDDNSPSRFGIILIVALTIGAFFLFSDSEQDSRAAADQDTASVAMDPQARAIERLADRFNADTTWTDELAARGLTILTEDLRRILAAEDNRPILARLEVVDLERRNGQYVGLFLHGRFRYRELIQFDLAMDSAVAGRLLDRDQDEDFLYRDIPVVAEIDSVSSRTLYSRGEESFYDLQKLLIAHGKVLGIDPTI